MAEEGVEVATLAVDAPPELKRKLEEVEPEQDDHQQPPEHDSETTKRPRLLDEPHVSASENGHQEDSSKVVSGSGDVDANADGGDGEEPPAETETETETETEVEAAEAQPQPQEENQQQTEGAAANESAPETTNANAETEIVDNDDSSQNDKVATKEEAVVTEPITEAGDAPASADPQNTSRKIQVPNNKVGVLIGKGGDTIRYLQYNSGAKIQIMRDAEADMSNPTRPVELIGSIEGINKAEKLIRDVIAEADAGGSPALVARGIAASQVGVVAEQIEIKVPNEKVGLIIGRGGDTIKGLQTRSGARIQLIPQHLPEGDESKERVIRVSGDKRQIDIATDMIKEVMRQKHSPLSGGFSQPYRPRGPSGSSQWGPRAPYHGQQMGYDYQHRGPYPSQNPQYPPPPYGGYPNQQAGPRGGFGSVWEQRPPTMQGQAHHGGGYDYYGGPGGQAQVPAPHSAPMSGHPGGQSAGHGVGPVRPQVNYNYGPSQGPDYGHPSGPYPQAGHPQQNYGQGYDGAPMQHSYGGSQPAYSQGAQSGYQQQYGKPQAYGMPPPSQSYAPPRAIQPGDVPYQGSGQPAQTYGSSMPPSQVAYSYPTSGPMQQAYPQTYNTAPTADAYNQQAPASGAGYQQPGGQPVPVYGQSDGQVQSYGQAGATAAYASYPSAQQGYPEQAAANSTGYVYQQPQDASYASTHGAAYAAAPNSQPAYAQQPPAQPSYDQSIPQSGGYSSVPASAPAAAPAGYAKTVSPQPSYPQYDSAQAYGTSR